jgi:hypothetical protein
VVQIFVTQMLIGSLVSLGSNIGRITIYFVPTALFAALFI